MPSALVSLSGAWAVAALAQSPRLEPARTLLHVPPRGSGAAGSAGFGRAPAGPAVLVLFPGHVPSDEPRLVNLNTAFGKNQTNRASSLDKPYIMCS